jgi:APA family basic amino acid/polyamine antiporter
VDFISFALTAAALFLLKGSRGANATPGHPYTTAIFVLVCAGIVASTVVTDPANSARGWAIILTGVPVYWLWSRRLRT